MAKGRHQATEPGLQAKTHLAKLRREFIYTAPEFVAFEAPFAEFFTAGWNYINVLHPVTKLLTECIKSIADKESVRGISEHDLGKVQDALEPLFGQRRYGWRHYFSGRQIDEKCEAIQRLFDLVSNLGMFELSGGLVWKQKTLNVPPIVKAGRLGAPIQSLHEVGLD